MILLEIDYGALLEESLKIGVPVVLAVFGGLGTLMTFFGFKSRSTRKEEANILYNKIGEELAVNDVKTNITAAIKLRRFFSKEVGRHSPHLRQEAIKVISSLSRVLSTGVYQKTLIDGLAYAKDLSRVDLVKTNLQDAYIGLKRNKMIINAYSKKNIINWTTNKRIYLYKTDFYEANLSYALFEYAKGPAIFGGAILSHTRFKKCDLRGANFRGADLSNVYFNKVRLKGADFSGAKNIPLEIEEKIKDTKYIYQESQPFTSSYQPELPQIFFSMPSVMTDIEQFVRNKVKEHLEKSGFMVIPYTRDDYPHFGQIEKVAMRIKKASGMIVFGFKQTHIVEGCYRPNTDESTPWKDKWLPSPWNEIEVGMAAMRDIPILIIKDAGIDTGVFDDVLSEVSISTLMLSQLSNLQNWNECHELQNFVMKAMT